MDTKKSLALAALMAGKNQQAAAAAANVTDRTLRRWLSEDDEFQVELSRAKTDILDGLKRKTLALGDAAIGGFVKCLKGEMGQTAHYRASADILRALGVIGKPGEVDERIQNDEISVTFGDFKPESGQQEE